MKDKLTVQVSVTGLSSLISALKQEDQRQIRAMQKAQTKVCTEAVKKLKDGLNNRFGKEPGDKNYRSSPKFSLPYMHSGRLRNSIGFKVITIKDTVKSAVGSGARGNTIDYAKYLEGRNHDGIRPFLWAIQELYTPERVQAYFDQYYEPLI